MKPIPLWPWLCLGVSMLAAGPLPALELDAELAWGRRLELSLPLSGPVSEVAVAPGQRVAEGETLLALDQRLYRARLEQARAGLEQARQDRAEAQRELDRAEELYDRTVLSDHDLTKARIAAAAAEAARRRAAAALTEAELELEYSRLQAPFDGVVLAVLAAPGQALVNRLRAQPLVVLADDRRLRALGAVGAEQAVSLSPGQGAEVELAGEWLAGELILVGREPLEQGYPIEVGFEAPAGVTAFAGQRLRVRIDD